jgi:hypothetical protein
VSDRSRVWTKRHEADADHAQMILSRIYNGLVARMILPLGLNVRSAELSLKSVMLPPPADALEREERRAAMWFALYHDTVCAPSSRWHWIHLIDSMAEIGR